MGWILIVENEIEQAKYIEQLLRENGQEEIEVFTENTSVIIEKVRKEEPTLAIMAININGINGLELAKRVKQFTTRTQFIFISVCDYFEFAREALLLGAVNYILKPINEKIFLDSVKCAFEKYNFKKKSIGKKEKKEIVDFIRHMEYSFMYTARFNEDFLERLEEYKKILKLGKKGYVMNIEIDSLDENSGVNIKKDEEMIYHYLKKIVNQHNNCVISPRVGNRILVFVDTENEKQQIGRKSSMLDIKLAAHIIVSLKENFNMSVSVGIGSERPLKEFHVSYEESVRCLRYRDRHNVVRIKDIERVDISHEEYIKLENQMLKEIKSGSAKTVDLFAELLDMIRPLTEERRRNKILELLILAGHEARVDGQDEIGFVNYGTLFEQYKKIPIDKIEMWAYQNFESILTSVTVSRQGKKSESIRLAIRYMEDHYMEQLTLEEIASYVGVTPQHFSKIFKKEMGINYVEWLTNYRIDIAKKLLIERKSAIKEICYQVGYIGPNYFSRIFKKKVGVTPKEYIMNETEMKKTEVPH